MMAMSASRPPHSCTKRLRMRRRISLSSAPPIGTIQPRSSPSATLLGHIAVLTPRAAPRGLLPLDPGATRAPWRRARTAVAAAKIASFAVLAAAGVPTVGAFDPRHTDLEVRIPAGAPLFAGGGVLRVPAPGADGLLALPVRHGDAEAVRAARRFHAEEPRLLAREFHHALGRCGIAVVVAGAPPRTED